MNYEPLTLSTFVKILVFVYYRTLCFLQFHGNTETVRLKSFLFVVDICRFFQILLLQNELLRKDDPN